jgi:hypothetical protein
VATAADPLSFEQRLRVLRGIVLDEQTEARDRLKALDDYARVLASVNRVDFEDELPPVGDVEGLEAAEREHGISYLEIDSPPESWPTEDGRGEMRRVAGVIRGARVSHQASSSPRSDCRTAPRLIAPTTSVTADLAGPSDCGPAFRRSRLLRLRALGL